MFFSLLFTAQVFAATAPSLVQPYPQEVLRNEVVTFKPEKAHHFSAEAPQNCGIGKLIDKSVREIKCQFLAPGSGSVTLNVCDDKKTFCKPITLALNVSAKDSGQGELLTKNEKLNNALKAKLVPGFEMGPLQPMKAKAKELGKPVFMMISTDWCPPCNEAKEHLLSSEGFAKASEGWFKIYVDGDSMMAAEWEAAVPYTYYPSFVFLNSNLQEVARYTGPLRQQAFQVWSAEVRGYTGAPIATVRERVLARKSGGLMAKARGLFASKEAQTQDEARLLKYALDTEDVELVNKLVDSVKIPNLEADVIRFQITQAQKAQEKGGPANKDQRIELYHRLLNQLINKDGWAGAWADFCEFDSKACAPQNIHVQERLDLLAKRGDLSEAERASMMGEEYAILAFVYETLGKKQEEKDMAIKCVSAYEKMGTQSTLKLSRSAQQGRINCLESAGRIADAETATKALIEAYPQEPTFLMRMARIQRKAKKPAVALDWITKAEATAYGYNWFSAQLIKADILMEMKRTEQAKVVLKQALDQLALDSSQTSRNQRVASRLRAAQTKAESAGTTAKR